MVDKIEELCASDVLSNRQKISIMFDLSKLGKHVFSLEEDIQNLLGDSN